MLFLTVFLIGCSSQNQVTIHNATIHNASDLEVNASIVDLGVKDSKFLDVRVQNESVNNSIVAASIEIGDADVAKLDVALVGVNSLGDTCGIRVNEQTYWIEEGSVKRVDGLTIRVFEAFKLNSNPNAGACELMIGGTLLELTS